MNVKEITFDKEKVSFSYNGIDYDCSLVVERDIKRILQEADGSHPGVLDTLYKRNTLSPRHVKLYTGKLGEPLAVMVVYAIDYANEREGSRFACGDYYIGIMTDWKQPCVVPHPYQASICW